MWEKFDGKPYTREALAAHVAAIDFSKWRRKDGSLGKPLYIVLHNTSVPTIKLWLSWAPEKRQQYIKNVQQMYEVDDHWHAGPHFFVPPDDTVAAFGFSNPETCGTHASCFNSDSIGIEMVGEFNSEPFDGGPGALVRDNAILLMAMLHNKLGLQPEPYVYARQGLHFHVECRADNHDCPGRLVSKPDVIARLKGKMRDLSGPAPAPAPPMAATQADRPVLFYADGRMSTFGGPHDRGVSATEGLALFYTPAQMAQHGLGSYLLTEGEAGAPGLARRLDTSKLYIACRWHTNDYPLLRDAVAHVSNPANGRSELARPMDWGPHVDTGRVADLSPALATRLGLATDGLCRVTVYKDGK